MSIFAQELFEDPRDQEQTPKAPSVEKRRRSSDNRNHWARINPAELFDCPKYEPLPYLQLCRLIERAQQGDIEARNSVWVRHSRLVLSVSNGFHIRPDLLGDAVQEGNIGLHRAIERFEIHQYNAFTTYAWYWIRQSIQNFLYKNAFSIRVPVHLWISYVTFRKQLRQCNNSSDTFDCLHRLWESNPSQYKTILNIHRLVATKALDRVDEADHPRSMPQLDDAEEILDHAIKRLLKLLSERQRYIITLRYGLEGDSNSLADIGEVLGLSKERIRQLQQSAEQRVREHLPELEECILTDHSPIV